MFSAVLMFGIPFDYYTVCFALSPFWEISVGLWATHETQGDTWDFHMGLRGTHGNSRDTWDSGWGSVGLQPHVVVPRVPWSHMCPHITIWKSHKSLRVICGSPMHPQESHVIVPHVPWSSMYPIKSHAEVLQVPCNHMNH